MIESFMKLDTLDGGYSLSVPPPNAVAIAEMFTVKSNNPCSQYMYLKLFFSFFSVCTSFDPSFRLFLSISLCIYFPQWWTLEKPVILKKLFLK